MAGKQAKTLTRSQIAAALRHVRRHSRYPRRDRVMILLSIKAGLRAGEIKLTWPMLLTADGRLADSIALHDRAAREGSGRTIPLHSDLRRALQQLARDAGTEGAVIRSERAGDHGMRPSSIVNWFSGLYAALRLVGCSSHSGRRTFVTNAARLVFKAGGSLRDVQQLAGHRSIEQTQSYIDDRTVASGG